MQIFIPRLPSLIWLFALSKVSRLNYIFLTSFSSHAGTTFSPESARAFATLALASAFGILFQCPLLPGKSLNHHTNHSGSATGLGII